VQDVLAEVQGDEGLAGVLAVAVDAEGDGGGGAEGAAEGYDAEEDGGHDPGVMFLGGPSKTHEAKDGGDGDGQSHDEAELGFVQPAVAPRHDAHDDIADLPGDGGAENATDERRYIDQTSGESGEVVRVPAAVDDCYGLGENDEPSYGAGVNNARPENGRLRV
jgi:hypothetical protein